MAGTDVPESRQLMINLMYLVLTALLALNITREVLDAFSTMNDSIERSNASINNKSSEIYQQFSAAMQTADREKVRPWNDKALQLKERTDAVIKSLDAWKDSLIILSGGYELGDHGDSVMVGLDNISIANDLFVENEANGKKLQTDLIDYKKFALGLIDNPSTQTDMSKQFPLEVTETLPKTEDNPKGRWDYGTFHNIPVIAGVAMISKFQNDVKNSEALLLDYFQRQIYAEDFKFNTLKAIAVPTTTYALEGQSISATIMLAAYNKDAKGMSVSSSAGGVPVKDGVGELNFKASGIGVKSVNGSISIEKDGKRETYPWKFDYTVGSAGASLQIDKMNVMYIGVPNPVTLSASGFNIEDVSLSWSGQGVSSTGKGKGQYEVNVSTPGTIEYSINARNREGGTVKVGGGQIRVKRIPDPVAEIGGRSGGVISTGSARAQVGVVAELKDFVYDARFKISSFQFTYIPAHGQALSEANNGPYWSSTVKRIVEQSKPGDKWIISDIKAVGPDKTTREIPATVFSLR